MPDSAHVSRRTLLSALSGAAAIGAYANPVAGAGRAAPLRPVSMAMHIHGPFSEGPGSFEAHLDQARRTGVDVIWWTDHDFRVAAHDHRRAVHFTGPTELEGTLAWTWKQKTEGTLGTAGAAFVPDPHSPDDPPSALRLAATGGPAAGGILWYAGTAWNTTYSTCIADTTVEIDVRVEQDTADTACLVQLELSYHPAHGTRPAGKYALRYRIGGGVTQRRHVTEGLLGTVELPATVGQWQRLTLPLTDDVRTLWPDLVAEDNSLRNLQVGVQVGAGAAAVAGFDRLLFHRARRAGQQGEDLRAEVLDAYRDHYADIAHYRAYEVSLVRHLNWYGGDQTLPAFPSPPVRDNDPGLTRSMVDFLHSHGGVVCWNHPMDIESRESLAALMITQQNLGTDLVEIGREPFADLMWVLDVAARNAVFFTAIGSSDDHDGKDWLAEEERWLTYVWADSTDRSRLVDALRRGQAWFTDPAAYRGSLDIRYDGRTAMGGVLVTKAPVVAVDLVATDLPAGAVLEVVTGVVDYAGTTDLAPATRTMTLTPTVLSTGPFGLAVATGASSYLRTQVRGADGTVLAVSNPLWLLRAKPPAGVPSARRIR